MSCFSRWSVPRSQLSVRRCPQPVAAKQDKDPVWGLSLGSWLLPDPTAGHTLCLIQGRAPYASLAAILTQPSQPCCWGLGSQRCWSCSEGAGPQQTHCPPWSLYHVSVGWIQFCVCCVMLEIYLSVPGGACWCFATTSETAVCYSVCRNWTGTGSVSSPWLGNDRLATLRCWVILVNRCEKPLLSVNCLLEKP